MARTAGSVRKNSCSHDVPRKVVQVLKSHAMKQKDEERKKRKKEKKDKQMEQMKEKEADKKKKEMAISLFKF